MIKKCLEYNNSKGDFTLVKKMYFEKDKSLFTIKLGSDGFIKYWLDNSWNHDDKYLSEVLIKNIKSHYLLVNNFDSYDNNMDQFMKNQEYIMGLSITNNGYKDNLLKNIRNFLS